MSKPLPALRQPKASFSGRWPKAHIEEFSKIQNDQEFLILALKNSVKLVVRSDFFHCIRNVNYSYVCVLCNTTLEFQIEEKEIHKKLPEHRRFLKIYPYLEELAENLIRQIDNQNCYCTLCNILTPVHSISRHVYTYEHKNELDRAILRAVAYVPCENVCE